MANSAKKLGSIVVITIISSVMVIASLASIGIMKTNRAYAATVTWVGTAGGGDGVHWSDPHNWSIGRLPSSTDQIEIDGNTAVNSQVHLDIAFTLDAFGTLTIDSGDGLVIDRGGSLTNSGTINNNSLFFTCQQQICGGINAFGSITNLGGNINNNGNIAPALLTNIGVINNNAFVQVANVRGTVFGAPNPLIVNSGTINNNPGSTMAVKVNNRFGGTINNNGIMDHPFNNSGKINNLAQGFIFNFQTTNNYAGAIIDNLGTINNQGTINNSATITDECGSTFINSGKINGNQPVNACFQHF